MSVSKEQIVTKVKEWIMIDEEIKELQKKIREKKQIKKNNSEDLIEIMKQNEIDCFDISNGKILYSVNKTKQSISKKFLLQALGTYFSDNEKQASEVTKHILDQREETVKESIRRKINKNK
jgi:hypothetical protein